jgi:hypothetical protein
MQFITLYDCDNDCRVINIHYSMLVIICTHHFPCNDHVTLQVNSVMVYMMFDVILGPVIFALTRIRI